MMKATSQLLWSNQVNWTCMNDEIFSSLFKNNGYFQALNYNLPTPGDHVLLVERKSDYRK